MNAQEPTARYTYVLVKKPNWQIKEARGNFERIFEEGRQEILLGFAKCAVSWICLFIYDSVFN